MSKLYQNWPNIFLTRSFFDISGSSSCVVHNLNANKMILIALVILTQSHLSRMSVYFCFIESMIYFIVKHLSDLFVSLRTHTCLVSLSLRLFTRLCLTDISTVTVAICVKVELTNWQIGTFRIFPTPQAILKWLSDNQWTRTNPPQNSLWLADQDAPECMTPPTILARATISRP